jgi:hypothetical protein
MHQEQYTPPSSLHSDVFRILGLQPDFPGHIAL